MKKLFLLLILISITKTFSQTNKELALSKAREAIQLMDNGEIDKSVELLKEGEKLDPENYLFSYEIAYAYVLKKDYKKAADILKKTKKFEVINSQVYQMLGNCYSYLGQPKKAIKEYEEGMKRFPNAGNLHLEKGNIFNQEEQYNEAIKNYENGIKVDPMYPSNYYQLALLYLNSNDKLSGLIYGEIFMNIERTTNRTIEISELLYMTYKDAITLGEEESKIDFCEIVIDAKSVTKDDLTLPLCAIFGKNFVFGILGQKEFNLDTLSQMRNSFIDNYFTEDYKTHPNVLFSYHKTLKDKGLFDAYNHYLFQMGASEQFDSWLANNEEAFNTFKQWYISTDNTIEINQSNAFIKQ
ncbi:tetratricopeptide repeat protein [uncultured Psychroserpens sp.]|uniref:tetratricopeptide repeat protein n=1 Tax=uncultured Psychroserpens sp. TaxID=255436 RepID=UPI002628F0EC|nr:tetratricopeptide repeat protein [uncultured Psychroserpens sp.]